MILAHKIRLKPNQTQLNYFARAAGVARFTYNWALSEWKQWYELGEKPSAYSLKKQFNAIKHEQFPFVVEVTKCAAEQAFADVGKAFRNFFRGLKKGQKVGYPKFKSKKRTRPSFYLSNDQFRFDGKRVKMPHIGLVKMREALRFDGKVMSARVGRDGNHWFISVQVEIDAPLVENNGGAVGIDLGISKLMTLSDGTVVENQRYTLKNEKRLRKLNKKLSRQVKGSSNWWKTVCKLRQLHAKIRNCRQDWIHKVTSAICANNRLVIIEDLNAKGMMANHRLAKHIADTSFGEIARQLAYKQHLYGSELVKISRWFPSSKTCSDCGHIQDMPLSDRVHVCRACGTTKDRDLNAAINIKNEGLRLRDETAAAGLQRRNACGHHIRPLAATVDEAGTFLPIDHF